MSCDWSEGVYRQVRLLPDIWPQMTSRTQDGGNRIQDILATFWSIFLCAVLVQVIIRINNTFYFIAPFETPKDTLQYILNKNMNN